MSYEESFLYTCDAEGEAPAWAIKQTFEENSSDLEEFIGLATPPEWEAGASNVRCLG